MSLEQNKLSNRTQDLVAQCKIVVYDWTTKALTLSSGVDSELAKTSALDVSSQILECSFSKTKGQPAGTFHFSLSNSPGYGSGDWKDLIKRGSWCLIYMSNAGDLQMTSRVGSPDPSAKKREEAKKLRCIGFIDRVAVRAQLNEKAGFDVTYEISGRDFGVVYEDTSIWHNVFKFDQIMLESLAASQLNITGATTIDAAMSLIHDLFFNPKAIPGSKPNDEGSLTSIALQWLMPRKMLQDLGVQVDSTPYWGETPGIKNFSETDAQVAIEKPTDYLSGNAWDQLKKLSVPQFHELFTETTDSGTPQLIFRPIPFAISKKNYPSIGKKIQFYKDLPAVTVDSLDVIDFSLGEDNHSRYNSFLATVSTSLIGVEDNISLLDGSGFPKHVQDSVKRYGFRPMHVTVDSIVKNAERSNGRGNPQILREFNWLLYDYWNNVVFSESGEAQIFGQNAVKLGKCLKFSSSTPYVSGKRYYIEGYTDSYSMDERGAMVWTQSIMLTHGFEERDLKTGTNFGDRSVQFNHEGEFTPRGSSTNGKNSR